MNAMRSTCRSRLGAGDIDFIRSVLGRSGGEARGLAELLVDADSRDLILDNAHLVEALQADPRRIPLSSPLYFYLPVREAFRRAGIEDREVADYVAGLLPEFLLLVRSERPMPPAYLSARYLFEMGRLIHQAGEDGRFVLRTHIAHYALVLAGLYPERTVGLGRGPGRSGLWACERLGRESFRIAAGCRLAGELGLRQALVNLSRRFRRARIALNELAERGLFDAASCAAR